MAANQCARQLAMFCGSLLSSAAALRPCVVPALNHVRRAVATSAAAHESFTRKDAINFLNCSDDPEVAASLNEYLRTVYENPGKTKPAVQPTLIDDFDLTTRIEQKYVRAQIVENSIQVVNVPLDWQSEGTDVSVRRFASELLRVGNKAGFQSPAAELSDKLSETFQTVDTVKAFLTKVKPYMSADFYDTLTAAVTEIETEIGGSLTFGKSSPGYDKFISKIQTAAAQYNFPWKNFAAISTPEGAMLDSTKEQHTKWQEDSLVEDLKAELEVLKAESVRIVDTHLSKTADQVRKEQEATLAGVYRRLEAAKGQKWAQTMLEDLAYVSWYDATVAANPTKGPAAS